MAIAFFKRYEKKFLVSKEQYEKLIPRLLEHMDYDEHCVEGSDYTIYNIYYDTQYNEIITHSISKPYYKEKLRVRSYKSVTDKNQKVFLELKKKIDSIVSKRRVILTMKEVENFINYNQKPIREDYLSNQVIEEIDYFLKRNKVQPAVVINYKRVAFFGKEDKDFRLTFDHKINTRRYNFKLVNSEYGEDLLEKGQELMEVKILGAIPLWLTHILSDLKIVPASFSKYGNEFKRYCLNANKEGRKEVC